MLVPLIWIKITVPQINNNPYPVPWIIMFKFGRFKKKEKSLPQMDRCWRTDAKWWIRWADKSEKCFLRFIFICILYCYLTFVSKRQSQYICFIRCKPILSAKNYNINCQYILYYQLSILYIINCQYCIINCQYYISNCQYFCLITSSSETSDYTSFKIIKHKKSSGCIK